MKNLHKFFNKEDLPWVKLIWSTCYNTQLPGHKMEGYSWWKSRLKLLPLFKENYKCTMGNGQTVLLWHDKWLDTSLISKFPELHSFVKNDLHTAATWISKGNPHQLLHTPLLELAYRQLNDLQGLVNMHWSDQRRDEWKGSGQGQHYSLIKMYKAIWPKTEGNFPFKWIWKTSNRLRYKIFFWLLLHDRVNSRNLARTKNMHLDNYNCVYCNEQTEETLRHLFWDCTFAQEC
jgi:hypothetical protein